MPDSRLDTKLEYLPTHYFLARGDNHEIRQMFKENDFYNFGEFASCNKQALMEMRRKKNNVKVAFNDRKITLIHDVVLYYHFLQNDTTTKALVEEPGNWKREDFNDWRDQGCHPTIASANASLSGTTTNATTSSTIASPEKRVQKTHG